MRRALAAVFVLASLLSDSAPARAAAALSLAIRGEHFVDASGRPVFVLGANYEGPADRAWRMWEDGLFDPALIAQDLDRARAANLTVLRVFVQRPVADDILAGRWAKLDTVLDLADRRDLRLILTFADYAEPDLARLVAVDTAVAARYRGRPTILAYDLKNEPRFGDLALADYPPGLAAALQDPALVAAVGETVARQDIAEYRSSEQGRRDIPARLSDDQAYVYANALAAYRRFLQDAQTWAAANDATSVRYLLSPASAGWDALKEALNHTFAAWLKPRLDALRAADPGRLVTVGQADAIVASLPVNAWLDYRALHRYPPDSRAGIRGSMALFDDVRRAVPGKPLIVGEFGFSNATLDEHRTAELEAEMAHAACNHGSAGVLKWMLNDFPAGANPRENAFGMYRADGSPKPVVAAFHGLGVLRPPARALTIGEPRPSDYEICGGRFFTQTTGQPPVTDSSGFAVTNLGGIPFWDAFQQLGGAPALGYPIGRRFMLDGFVVQPMQKVVFQWHPADQRVELLNVFDWLHDVGKDGWLESERQIPPVPDVASDAGQPWERVLARRLALLDANPTVKARFLAEPDWMFRFGLPVSVADYPGVYVVRAQRATVHQWKAAVPGARAGEITIGNGGEAIRDAGLVPAPATAPEPAP